MSVRNSLSRALLAASVGISVACGAADPGAEGPSEAPGPDSVVSAPTGPAAPLPGPGLDEPLFAASAAPVGACGDGEPATVLFLVDRSGSMGCNLPDITPSAACEATPQRADAAAPTKWEIVSQVMAVNLAALVPTSDADVAVSAGLSYFSRDNACGAIGAPDVAVAPMGEQQVQALQASLFGQIPSGPTPIVAALVTAYRHLHQELRATGNRYVVLLTDGSDPCQDEYSKVFPDGAGRDFIQELLDVHAPNALAANIRTFVVGAPGSEENAAVLSQLAVAGGTAPEGCDPTLDACHFDTTQGSFEEQFQRAMEEITAQVACPEIQ